MLKSRTSSDQLVTKNFGHVPKYEEKFENQAVKFEISDNSQTEMFEELKKKKKKKRRCKNCEKCWKRKLRRMRKREKRKLRKLLKNNQCFGSEVKLQGLPQQVPVQGQRLGLREGQNFALLKGHILVKDNFQR